MAVELTDGNFADEVTDEPTLPVLVDFWAPWCGPCRSQGPIIEALANEAGGRLKVCKMNVDDNGATPARYGVMSIPTLILFKNGEPVKKAVGLQSLAALKAMAGL
ncbi:MAG: thioredoxin [Clostridiales bacterium]|jgi:thioredoxin 1|nr:thioredoxin [Clostridiales bacterium]